MLTVTVTADQAEIIRNVLIAYAANMEVNSTASPWASPIFRKLADTARAAAALFRPY